MVLDIPLDTLLRLDLPVPRYTSYPTAPNWEPLSYFDYREKLFSLGRLQDPISVYIHIPFCRSMCLYCGCSVVLNRKPENEERYVKALIQEFQIAASHFPQKKPIRHLHFGGGTPTQLTVKQLELLLDSLSSLFHLDHLGEIAIEIDPRTVFEDNGLKLRQIKALGFNRVSFGVQDTSEAVQEAVKRRQSYEMTAKTYHLARSLQFDGINIDLIYGLPLQTVESFTDTAEKIIELKPDRIALFSYAKVPWLKAHQKAIPDKLLPATEEKFNIYRLARRKFLEAGYVQIGMDHFALPQDEISLALVNKTLHRNFQGYTIKRSQAMLSFGVTAIGDLSDSYFQNVKDLDQYYDILKKGELPVHRGLLLSQDDMLRKKVIHSLMCLFELDKELFKAQFDIPFDLYFKEDLPHIKTWIEEGFLIDTPQKIKITPLGELFIRQIASSFDGYLKKEDAPRAFSKGI